MIDSFDFKKYMAAERNFNLHVVPYMIVNDGSPYLSPDAPDDIKKMYKESLHWLDLKDEWQRITGEHFR